MAEQLTQQEQLERAIAELASLRSERISMSTAAYFAARDPNRQHAAKQYRSKENALRHQINVKRAEIARLSRLINK